MDWHVTDHTSFERSLLVTRGITSCLPHVKPQKKGHYKWIVFVTIGIIVNISI